MISIENLLDVKLNLEENFLKVKETLTRIGIASKKEQKLYQSCHILHKRGKYYITHFKEMFLLDGKISEFTEEDMGRRNSIAILLEEWGLLTIVDSKKIETPRAHLNQIKILSHNEKKDWILEAKYSIGKKRF